MKNKFSETQIINILKEGEVGIGVTNICRKYGIVNSTYYTWRDRYFGMTISDLAELKKLKEKLMLLAKEYPRYGFGKMFNKLKLSGYKSNHKKVYRAYCELKLALRIKKRKRLHNRSPEILAQPISPNICCSIDFMSDSLRNGRKFRTFLM